MLEPRDPSPRLADGAACASLSEADCAWRKLFFSVVPCITDSPRDLEALLRAAAEAGATMEWGRLTCHPLFLKPCSQRFFFLSSKQFPQLADN